MKRKSKMGRPRTDDEVVRVSRGIRLNPWLIDQVNDAVAKNRIKDAANFNDAVEIALTKLLANIYR